MSENSTVDKEEGKRDYGDTVGINTRIPTELAEKLKEGNPGVSMSKIIQAALTEYASRKRCVCGSMNDGEASLCKKCGRLLFSLEEIQDAIVVLANSGAALKEPVSPNNPVDMNDTFTRLKQQGIAVDFKPTIKMLSGRVPQYMVVLKLTSKDGVELSLKDGYNEYVVDEKAIYYYLTKGKIPYRFSDYENV